MKTCTKCGVEKATSEFGKAKHHRDGLKSHCKKCLNQLHKQYYKDHQEEEKQGDKKYRQGHKDKIKQRKKQYYQDHKGKMIHRSQQYYKDHQEEERQRSRRYHYKSNYGLTLEDCQIIYNKLDGKCPLCLKLMIMGGNNGNSVHVDHDHATGNIRGFLCANCNRLLGISFDNPDTLRRAADYLDKRNKKGGEKNVIIQETIKKS